MSDPLIVPVRMLNFGRSEGDKLKTRLDKDSESLAFKPVTQASDLMFTADGLLQGKYRLNTGGAAQLFGEISSGFYAVVRSLLSDDHPDIRKDDVGKLVCGLSNRVVSHRIPALLGCRLICDEERMEVDGFVGRSYVLVRNSKILEQFNQASEILRGSPKFFTAQLIGRDLTAIFLSQQVASDMSSAVKAYSGAVIQNRETAGRAIRACSIVMDTKTRSWSADRFYPDTRVPHVRSKQLRARMMRMGDALSQRQPVGEAVSSVFDDATNRTLGGRFDEKLHRQLRKMLSVRADGLYVSMTQIDAVLEELGIHHSHKPTLFDVYACCLKVASQSRLGASLPLRQLAWAVVAKQSV